MTTPTEINTDNIEFFYEPQPKLIRCLSIVRWMAQFELVVVAAFGYTRILWVTATTTQSLLFLAHVLHLFSWAASLCLTSRMYHLGYILMTTMVYIVCFMADFSVMIYRAVNDPLATDYTTAAIIFNVLLVIIDIIISITDIFILAWTKQFKDTLMLGLKQLNKGLYDLDFFTMNKGGLMFLWFGLKILGIIELVCVIVMIIFFALGLNINSTFAYLLLFQLPHMFLWVILVAISCRIRDTLFIQITIALYAVSIIFDGISTVYRIILIGHCSKAGTCGFVEPFCWVTVGLTLLLISMSFIDILLMFGLIKTIKKEILRIVRYVPRRLNIVRPKTPIVQETPKKSAVKEKTKPVQKPDQKPVQKLDQKPVQKSDQKPVQKPVQKTVAEPQPKPTPEPQPKKKDLSSFIKRFVGTGQNGGMAMSTQKKQNTYDDDQFIINFTYDSHLYSQKHKSKNA